MQCDSIDKGGLRKRLWRMILTVGVLVASTAGPADAANSLGVAFDPTFGNGGFAALPAHPSADPGTPVTPIGLIRLDTAGGYVAATLQQVSGNARIVLTRYAENGQLDTGWGSGGNQLPAIPSPYVPGGSVNAIKLVAGREGGQDIFYLAFSLFSSPDLYVAVGKFQASGAFDASFGFGGYATSKLPVSAPAGLATIQGAAFTEVFGLPVLVVAVNANGNRLVFTRAHGSGTASLSDQGGGSSLVMGATPTILQMRTFGPNHVEIAGTAGNNALYIDYDAGTLTAVSRVFRLPCPAGSNWSTLDAVARPAAFGGDALVYGRSYCIGVGAVAIAARVANITAPSPSFVWSVNTEVNTICNGGPSPCPGMLLAYDDAFPAHALTVTPLLGLVPVRVADGTALPSHSMIGFGSAIPQPSTYRGHAFRQRRLVGFGSLSSVEGVTGLLVDGLFINGFE